MRVPRRNRATGWILLLTLLALAGCASRVAVEERGWRVADFETGVSRESGWRASTDSVAGGTSRVELRHSRDGAASRGSLEIAGAIGGGLPYAWAGAIWYPGGAYSAPGDLSGYSELRFWARGTDGMYRVMVMWQDAAGHERRHQESFRAGEAWAEHVVRLEVIPGLVRTSVIGVLFAAGPGPGPFAFRIDRVRLLP